MKRLLFILLFVASAWPQTAGSPVLLFTDLVSGPATGNSDDSQAGQVAGEDGVIVTVWGKYLGTTPGTITVGGLPARIYFWGNATAPADLYTRHKMQMVAFQIPNGLSNGTMYQVQATTAGGIATNNTLPFTVRAGNIYYVATTGSDSTGTGSWSAPWAKISTAVGNLMPGDTVYARDGVQQTTSDGDQGSMFNLEYDIPLNQMATQAMPKAVVAYPNANVTIGTTTNGGWSAYSGSGNPDVAYWTFSKLNLVADNTAAVYSTGFRIIGNHVSAPNGDQQAGGIDGNTSASLFVLGNEVTHVGYAGTSKLYHPVYIKSRESSTAPREPAESNREIAWNHLHDNYAYDGINIYRENTYSGFMLATSVHDNFVVNQTGRGMLIGQYVLGPDNYIYNNVIISAGKGPDSTYDTNDQAFNYQCVYFGAGMDGSYPNPYTGQTIIHFYNNTLYDCGWNDPGNPSSSSLMVAYDNTYPFTLDFHNNLVLATSWPYFDFGPNSTVPTGSNNLWYGQGAAPAWSTGSVNRNPLLLSPAAPPANVHLEPVSPAIGAGTTAAPSVAVDFDNLTRPSPPSIGAFEYAAAAGALPASPPRRHCPAAPGPAAPRRLPRPPRTCRAD